MKILRYLTREVLTHMIAVSFVLLVIIISGRFVKYLAEAVAPLMTKGGSIVGLDFDATVALHPSAAEELVTMRNPVRSHG